VSSEQEARFSRRGALAGAGTVTLAGILAACGSSDDTTEIATTHGGTAGVRSQTGDGAPTAELLDRAGTCSLTPQQTSGPFYFDVDRIRSDIREDRQGTPLRLALRVRDAQSCEPVRDAVVEVWHCDAAGGYSGFDPAAGAEADTTETFLRGALVTDAGGIVEFKTIYPGWYPGRTVHVHATVHLDGTSTLMTQLYFDDAFTDRAHAAAPYSRGDGRDTLNSDDAIFDQSLLLTLSRDGDGNGVTGALNFGVESA
jgi:protocatechuate 3,4-dioxygenase beta subunit